MDDFGDIVSQFVEERVDGPRADEIDLWCEATSAGLFSAGFQVITRLQQAKASPHAFEQHLNSLIESTARHASKWINTRLAGASSPKGPRIQYDMYPLVRSRLAAYFNEALRVVTEKGYKLEAARSHACFAILTRAVESLTLAGQPISPRSTRAFLENAMEGCDHMSVEIAAALEQRPSL